MKRKNVHAVPLLVPKEITFGHKIRRKIASK